MAKRENEGKKEKKQKKERKERKIKRKQYGGLLLNPISVSRARTRACEGRRIACTCSFAEAGEAAMEIIDNCFGSIDCDFRTWAWHCRHTETEILFPPATWGDFAASPAGDVAFTVTTAKGKISPQREIPLFTFASNLHLI